MPLSRVKSPPASLNEQAYTAIRDAILAGKLPPGSPLSRRRLAQELGMSTLPVADALSRLESDGLVESRARAGTRVRIPTVSQVRGNYIVREALETHSARLFAEMAPVAKRDQLIRLAVRLDRVFRGLGSSRRPDPDRHAGVEKLHLKFHMFIAEATGCKELAVAIERSRVLLFNWLFGTTGEFVPLPDRWHSDLAALLTKGRPSEAAEAMRTHVTYQKDAIIGKFRTMNDADRLSIASISRGPQRTPRKKLVPILASRTDRNGE
jgi:DNA-binding GntR family transcriptional regulator